MDLSSLCRVNWCALRVMNWLGKVMNIKKKKNSEDGGERLLLACIPGVVNRMFLSPKGGPSPKPSPPM